MSPNMRTRVASVLATMLAVASANADPATVVRVFINQDPSCKVIADTIYVVMNGKEHAKVEARRIRTATEEYWEGSLKEEAICSKNRFPSSYDAANSEASLRGMIVDGGQSRRSGCKKSISIKPSEQNRAVAKFTFDCSRRDVKAVDVELSPSELYLGYTRSSEHEKPKDSCEEWGFFEGGPVTIGDLWPDEKVRLHLDWDCPVNPDAPGVILFEMDYKRPGRVVLGRALGRYIENGEVKTLNREKAVLVLKDQRAAGDGSGPTISSASIDVDLKKFSNARMEKLTIKVK